MAAFFSPFTGWFLQGIIVGLEMYGKGLFDEKSDTPDHRKFEK